MPRRLLVLLSILLFAMVPAAPEAHEFDYSIVDISFDPKGGQADLAIRTHVSSLVVAGRASAGEEDSLRFVVESELAELERLLDRSGRELGARIDVVGATGRPLGFDLRMPEGAALHADAQRLLAGPVPSTPIALRVIPGAQDEGLRIALPPSLGRTMVRLHCDSGLKAIEMIDPGQWSQIQSCAKSAWSWDVALQLAKSGFGHVLPSGWDHILFVVLIGFSLLALPRMILFASVFTLGHAVALFLAAAGCVALNPMLVETGIALSVAVMAMRLILRPHPLQGNSIAFLLAVFGAGLLHGAGFAQSFLDLGTGHASVLGAALVFSLGVDIAHIAVLGAVWLLLLSLRHRPRTRGAAVRAASALVLCVALCWAAERLGLF